MFFIQNNAQNFFGLKHYKTCTFYMKKLGTKFSLHSTYIEKFTLDLKIVNHKSRYNIQTFSDWMATPIWSNFRNDLLDYFETISFKNNPIDI